MARSSWRRFSGLVLVAALSVAAAALSQPAPPVLAQSAMVPIAFQLNFTAGGYNSGFALALQEGVYKRAGLDVTLVKGQGSGTTAQLVAPASPTSRMRMLWR